MEHKYCLTCMKPMDKNSMTCAHCNQEKSYEVSPHQLNPGTLLIDKYLIGNVIGEGGFGITYIGRDINLDMRIAVKEYYPNGLINRNNTISSEITVTTKEKNEYFEKGKSRFLEEARILAKLSGEKGIVDVRDFFQANNTAYIVMEYLDGITLKEHLSKKSKLDVGEVLEMMKPLMDSLENIHAQGLIHRDISPDNIMIDSKRKNLKLLDFGAARDISGTDPKSLSVILKPGYAPEEQYRSKGVQGPWTDVYALCATIYRCITGVTPDDSMQRVFQDETRKPSEFGVNITSTQEETLMKGMSILQKDRYQSVKEFRIAIEGIKIAGDSDDIKSISIENTFDGSEKDMSTVDMQKKEPSNKAEQIEKIQPVNPVQSNPRDDAVKIKDNTNTKPNNPDINKKLIAIIASVAGVFVIGAIMTVVIVLMNNNIGEPAVGPSVSPSTEATQVVKVDPTYETHGQTSEAVSESTPDEPQPPESVFSSGRNIIAAKNHTVALKDDGTVLVAGWEGRPIYTTSNQVLHFSRLMNVQKMVGNSRNITVLHSTGEVSTSLDINDLNRYQGIIDVAVGSSHIIALKSDGTVIASGYDSNGETKVTAWKDIVAVYAGRNWSVGLKSDGTVVATGKNDNSQCDVSKWTNVKSIVIGYDYTLGITENGSILGKGGSFWSSSSPIELNNFKNCIEIAGGDSHLVGLKSDGTVMAEGRNYYGQCDVFGWTDVVKIAAAGNLTVGLKSDGTILVTGKHDYAQYNPAQGVNDVSDIFVTDSYIAWVYKNGTLGATGDGYFWDLRLLPDWLEYHKVADIGTIATGDNFVAVLTKDSKIYVWGDNNSDQRSAEEWTSITTIAAGSNFLLGLKSDGTVVSTYKETYNPIDVSSWSDIVAIDAGRDFAVGLKSNGTVVAAGEDGYGQTNVRGWKDIIAISVGKDFVIGLKADGTCEAAGYNGYKQCDVYDWTDITRIAASDYITAAIRRNGSVIITGNTGYGNNKIDVSLWSDIIDIAVGYEHAIGLKSDGTFVSSGANSFGQSDVKGWSLR